MTAPRKGATPEQQVVALGRLIEDQARQITALKDEIERRFNAQAGDVSGVARTAEDLARDVGTAKANAKKALELVVSVAEQLAAAEADDEERKRPLNLLMPEDRDAALEALRELRDWLRAVYVRYEGGGDQAAPVLSDCWAWHTGAVTELYVLHRMWFAAYQGPRASDQLVADWHDRYRPGTVRRVNAALKECRPEKHVDRMRYRPPGVHGDELLDDLADWMVTGEHGRKAPPPPTPAMVADARARRAIDEE
jgi:hypothetical protein